MNKLTSTQTFWLGHLFQASSLQLALSEYAMEQGLGHLFQASSLQLALSEYAMEQGLDLTTLMTWEKRLAMQGILVPPRHRPARFVAVEIVR